MTEAEAKTKRCCSGAAAHPQHDGMCAGSDCVAWRLLPQRGRITNKSGGHSFETDQPATYGPDAWDIELFPVEGFCGLAGRPG